MTDYYKSISYDDEKKYDPVYASEDDSIHLKPSRQQEKLDEYMKQLLTEKLIIDEKQCPYAYRYICEEIHRVREKLVKGPPRDTRFIDLYNEKPTKVTAKVLLPIKEHPNFNFIGKLLGPKGIILKQLQEETKCFMNICGRGSMRDHRKEEELRQSLELKYSHLSDDLHVEISTIAGPSEAHTRMAAALREVQKYLIPDTEDVVLLHRKSIFGVNRGNGELREQESGHPTRNERRIHEPSYRGMPRSVPRPVITSKSSVMSILNKARIAMEESYSYQERRHRPKEFEYDEYQDGGYPPKRYHEEKEAYGKHSHDVIYKKRKMYED